MIITTIVSVLIFLICSALAILLAGKYRGNVLTVLYRITGEKNRYIDDRIAKVLIPEFALIAVAELLNLIFSKTIWVPIVCMIAACAACYLTMLSIDRRCIKRDRGRINTENSESYHMEETDRRETL